MSRPVVVPLDGSSFAEQSLPLAVEAARRASGTIHLVAVVTPSVPPRFMEHMTETEAARHEEARKQAQLYLNGVGERLTAEAGLSVQTSVRMGPIADAVDDYIREVDGRLVVMTTHGRGPVRRAWLGSVADSLVRRTPSPLLLVPPRRDEEVGEPGHFKHVLIPLDGSPAARIILDPAVELAGTQGVRYTLLRVVLHPVAVTSSYLPDVVAQNRRDEEMWEEAEKLLAERRGEMEERGVSVDVDIVEGTHAGSAILRYAEDQGVDLIAMTTEGRGGIARLVLGSTADKVIRGSDVPVLVHRRAEG